MRRRRLRGVRHGPAHEWSRGGRLCRGPPLLVATAAVQTEPPVAAEGGLCGNERLWLIILVRGFPPQAPGLEHTGGRDWFASVVTLAQAILFPLADNLSHSPPHSTPYAYLTPLSDILSLRVHWCAERSEIAWDRVADGKGKNTSLSLDGIGGGTPRGKHRFISSGKR